MEVIVPTGRCRNCSVPTQNVLCERCRNYKCCSRCYRYLPTHLYHNDCYICNTCQNSDASNVSHYAIDRLIGDRTWTGTLDDISVSDFIHRISDDVMSTYETATVENVAIKYNGQHKMVLFKVQQPGSSSHQQPRMWRTWTLTTC